MVQRPSRVGHVYTMSEPWLTNGTEFGDDTSRFTQASQSSRATPWSVVITMRPSKVRLIPTNRPTTSSGFTQRATSRMGDRRSVGSDSASQIAPSLRPRKRR